MICDFCSTPDPEWTHIADRFSANTPLKSWNDDGNWAACKVCHALIENGDRDALLRRCVQYDPDPSLDGAQRRVKTLHDFFWRGYHGRFEPMPKEELEAEHRLIRFRQPPGKYQAVCICGWQGDPDPDYRKAREEFEAHSGGSKWSVVKD